MRKLLLQHYRAPGDVLVMSALVRDIALTYPEQFQIGTKTVAPELWQYNPHVTQFSDDDKDVDELILNYGPTLNHVGHDKKHFLQAFHADFEHQTTIKVPLLYPRPDYHLSDEEKDVPLVSGRYWVIVSGGKSDFITKHWVYKRAQQVVNLLRQTNIHCVQLGAIGKVKDVYHFHPRLENTLCLVGLTTLRDMARLIYHADGVICPVTVAMHFAAALQKPCVVVAGGREEWWWEAYVTKLGNFGTEINEDVAVPHRFLHTIGLLDCCQQRGCWKNTLTSDAQGCKHVETANQQQIPRCMDLITVEHVLEAVMSYYEDGTLLPIGQPKAVLIENNQLKRVGQEKITTTTKKSALVRALTPPEPHLLRQTARIQQLANILNK